MSSGIRGYTKRVYLQCLQPSECYKYVFGAMKGLYTKKQIKKQRKKSLLFKNKNKIEESMKETFKLLVNENVLDRTVQTSATQHEVELIMH